MCQINLKNYKNKDFSVYTYLNKLDNYVANILSKTKNINEISDFIPDDVKYFINPLKVNLINHINFKSDDSVLNVNDVFGILSEYLCDKVKEVKQVEFSNKIAQITKKRLEQKNNLEIIVGNLNDIDFEEKFDYIILTDILELTKILFHINFSFEDCLNYFGSLLKSEGKIILNISNQLGIKNWAGAKEEHFGKVYDSLLKYFNSPIELFSQEELDNLFTKLGFVDLEHFYPVPSHYCPQIIIKEPSKTNKEISKYYQKYNLPSSKILFDEKITIEEIISNDKFYLFANSYMIIAKKGVSNEQS